MDDGLGKAQILKTHNVETVLEDKRRSPVFGASMGPRWQLIFNNLEDLSRACVPLDGFDATDAAILGFVTFPGKRDDLTIAGNEFPAVFAFFIFGDEKFSHTFEDWIGAK